MSKLSSGSWWSSLGFGRRGSDAQTDFGDMGTAFGLDACIEAQRDTGSAPWRESETGRPPLGDRPGRSVD